MKEPYIHNPGLAYPDADFTHMIQLPKAHDFVYDEHFMYRLGGAWNIFIKTLIKVLFVILVQPVCAVRYALKIQGKKHIREYFSLTDSKGMISICNHTTQWDTIFVSMTRWFSFAEFPVWQEGAESKGGMLYRRAGGLVMPRFSLRGMHFAYEAMKDVVNEGKWLHVFPEAACWAFYPAVRPFQPGTFRLAYELNKPILPMAVSYRAPRGLYRLFKKHPNATIAIGAPLTVNRDLPKKEAVADLERRSHLALITLLGMQSEEENAAVIARLKTYHVETVTP